MIRMGSLLMTYIELPGTGVNVIFGDPANRGVKMIAVTLIAGFTPSPVRQNAGSDLMKAPQLGSAVR